MLVKEDTKYISIQELKEWKTLYCDDANTICKQGYMNWSITRNGIEEITSSLSFQINYEQGVANALTLSYSLSNTGENIYQYIGLERTECNYGGNRFWFFCPKCNQRSAKLYFSDRNYICRICANLTYESNNRSKRQRSWDNIFNLIPNFSADPTPLDKVLKRAARYPEYKGNPTKAYNKAMRIIQSIPSADEVERILTRSL